MKASPGWKLSTTDGHTREPRGHQEGAELPWGSDLVRVERTRWGCSCEARSRRASKQSSCLRDPADVNKGAAAAHYINADPPEPVSDGSREQHQLSSSRSSCGWRVGRRPARWEWHRIRKATPTDHDRLATSCGQPVRRSGPNPLPNFLCRIIRSLKLLIGGRDHGGVCRSSFGDGPQTATTLVDAHTKPATLKRPTNGNLLHSPSVFSCRESSFS
ncbi:hypothetical protein B296_00033606 [Ensete ventricosum]|uniref:Uncharacterized protein n=1 Tax=Ensete ventricosum TaxID=4639 RepID=A0A426ZDW5_ENSVE|nr:hypothetical protein B296_00033606 [Ensete ventricosum]